jgi:(R,R)-butanediol dehydrogenase/meso-butanediol dehydrogenase/diacetyl reductase
VSYVAVCGSDQARFEGRLETDKPVVFGHEFSGRVSDVGSRVEGLEVGEAVTVAPLLNCGECRFCLTGHEYLCPERRIFGSEVDGAMQAYVCIRADRVFSLPKGVSLQEGALAEPLAVAVHAGRQAGMVEGRGVVTLGAGAIGLLIAQVARARGARDVVMLDVVPGRLRLADELGFATVNGERCDPVGAVREQIGGRGADVLFEATGSPAVADYFLPMLAPLGVIVVVGRVEDPVPLDLDQMLLKEARLVTSRYFTVADFRRGLDLLAAEQVSLTPLVQQVMPFERLREGEGEVVMGAARQVVRLLIERETDSMVSQPKAA